MTTALEQYSKEFQEQVKAFREDWYQFYKNISNEETPQVDGTGMKIIDKKGKYDYIVASYMVDCLDKHFPGWSWEIAAPLQFLGSEWVVAQGTLTIIDERLAVFGIHPPVRKFYGCNADRVAFRQEAPHTIENIIDIGNDVKSANTEAMKVAINRLCHIGDDVYGKRIEGEGAGTFDDIVAMKDAPDSLKRQALNELVNKELKGQWSKAFGIIGVTALSEITDFQEAYNKIKEALG